MRTGSLPFKHKETDTEWLQVTVLKPDTLWDFIRLCFGVCFGRYRHGHSLALGHVFYDARPVKRRRVPKWGGMTIGLAHFYILGAWTPDGHSLTTWDGPPTTDAVLYGATLLTVPMWQQAAPPGARLELIPAGEDPRDFAFRTGGIHVIGWVLESRIERGLPRRPFGNWGSGVA